MRRLIPENLVKLLQVRDFVWLWSGATVSLFGDGIYFVTIAWEVYRISNAPTALGVVSAAFALPQVLLLVLGGILSDRLDRRLVMFLGNLVSGLMMGGLGTLVLLHQIRLWEIVVLVAVYGVSQAFFMPASRAIVPGLIDPELMPQAMALEQFVQPLTSSLIGPAVGGLLVAAGGTGLALLIDAGTFVVAAAALLAMSSGHAAPAQVAAGEAQGRFAILRDVRLALQFVRGLPWIWAGLAAAGIANIALTGPLTVLIPYLIKYRLHSGPQTLGLFGACGGLGAILAAVYVGWHGVPRRSVSWIFLSWAVGTAALVPMGLAGEAWELLPLALVTFGGITLGNVIWFSRMGVEVPGYILGRVASLDMMVSFSLTPLSNAVTGPLAGVIGARQVLVVAGALGAVVPVLLLLTVPGLTGDRRPGTGAAAS
ncbi:MAG TPA: MFS transporter [Candidatus Saccharimonadales bacterium]|nr:MFS transporter [Candidatus Saccharimonadales bacterium]